MTTPNEERDVAEQRNLALRIRILNRTAEQEMAILAKVREALGRIPGEPRPTLEVASATSEDVSVTAE